MNQFLELLCLPSVNIFLSVQAQKEQFFFMDDNDFNFNFTSVLLHIFYLDFHVALPKRPDPGNTRTNPLAIRW